MFGIGYWALGNSQIFYNLPPIDVVHANAPPNTKHGLF